jgi:pyridoxine 5-phosphate synthase
LQRHDQALGQRERDRNAAQHAPPRHSERRQNVGFARAVGLGVNAGHDLNLLNLGPFLERVGKVDEVSIGHALIADALEFGMADTVRRYRAAWGRPEGEVG